MVKEKDSTLGGAGINATEIADRDRMTEQALSAIRRTGPAAALDRCRVLADRINAMLSERETEQLADTVAELQAYLERAAAVLKQM
jgi:hypothetical protein